MRPPKYLTKTLAVLILCLIGTRNALCEDVNFAHGLESSLGQLCKLAQTVVSGHLVGVETTQDEEIIVSVAGSARCCCADISATAA